MTIDKLPILTTESEMTAESIIAGGFFLIDKPIGWTSFDVVNKLRYALKRQLNLKKFKVGHAGTLDPLATGLLLIAFGRATKSLTQLLGKDKTYEGTITIGAETSSYDAETEIENTYPITHITQELVEEKVATFVGTIQQIPPIFSAIKKNGVAAYKKARKGEAIKMDARTITIYDFDAKLSETDKIDFVVACSTGTYIRSLAYDMGKALNSGGFLSALRRTKISSYEIENAMSVETALGVISQIKVD